MKKLALLILFVAIVCQADPLYIWTFYYGHRTTGLNDFPQIETTEQIEIVATDLDQATEIFSKLHDGEDCWTENIQQRDFYPP